jgi:hypothetical protein
LRVSAATLLRVRATTPSSPGASSTSAIRWPSCSHSISPNPRVVTAGLPMRMPDVTNGF